MKIIKEVKIKGFKSIKEQTLDLAQLNVFIGTNGAGKSNFLEALAILSASAEGGIDYKKLSSKGARLSSPEIFRSSFRNFPRKKHFELAIKIENYTYNLKLHTNEKTLSYFSERLSKNNRKIAGRSGAGSSLFNQSIQKLSKNKSILSVLQNYEGEHNSLINKIANFSIFSPSTPILRGVASDNSFQEPLGIYGGGLAKALANILEDKNKKRNELQRFFYLLDWFQSVGITDQINTDIAPEQSILGNILVTYKDKFMKTNFNNLYAYDVSEGALYILFVLVLLIHENSPDIFAIDNIDSTLNPGLVRELMKQIIDILEKNSEKQIFLTTHNPTTLDAIDLFNPNHRLFVVSRNEVGETQFNRIKPPKNMTKEKWEETHYGLKLSEIWLSGAIGGLPKGF
jgi:predicted ATPase